MAMIGGMTVGLVLLLALAGIGLFIHRRFVSSTPGLPKGLGWMQKGRAPSRPKQFNLI